MPETSGSEIDIKLREEAAEGRALHGRTDKAWYISQRKVAVPWSIGVFPYRDKKLDSPLVIQEETVSDLLSHLDLHKSRGPDGIHLRVMRELAEELAKLLSIIYQQYWFTGKDPDD
ncbi:hypothetical protein WISP_91385 [Willisornis vidua]|uniref:Uncharacterized protein n=1 Tax=Willisornis vidua TaxID=1566151 RepID=A0ABQ9D1G5_9PASS|nr:hypothetical protein WISP_91385 [Willisornis vidua]